MASSDDAITLTVAVLKVGKGVDRKDDLKYVASVYENKIEPFVFSQAVRDIYQS
jgi:hypothetical protein